MTTPQEPASHEPSRWEQPWSIAGSQETLRVWIVKVGLPDRCRTRRHAPLPAAAAATAAAAASSTEIGWNPTTRVPRFHPLQGLLLCVSYNPASQPWLPQRRARRMARWRASSRSRALRTPVSTARSSQLHQLDQPPCY